VELLGRPLHSFAKLAQGEIRRDQFLIDLELDDRRASHRQRALHRRGKFLGRGDALAMGAEGFRPGHKIGIA